MRADYELRYLAIGLSCFLHVPLKQSCTFDDLDAAKEVVLQDCRFYQRYDQ